MIFQETFKTGLKDIGKNNTLKNRAILEMFENIGAYHSDQAGYGARDTKDTKVTWILLDWKIEVIKRPVYGQKLEIHTWGRKMVKFYSYRDFEMFDEQGDLCVIGTSKWVLIDAVNRKMTRIGEEILQKYQPEKKHVFLEEELDKLREPNSYSSSIIYEVNRKDIDINGHMHNLYYLDLAYEALPEEVYEQRPFNHVRITYKREIKLGEKVVCKYAQEEKKHKVVIWNEEEKVIHAIIQLW